MKEPGVASLILKTVLEKHVDEIRRDPEFRKAVFRMVFEKASPELLRKWAKASASVARFSGWVEKRDTRCPNNRLCS
jgi:hypothetical protein